MDTHSFNESEAWLVIQKKHSTQPGLSLADAVEEALCFGWIDSTLNTVEDQTYLLRFSPRKPKSVWSIWLMSLIGLAFLAGLAYMMMQADLIVFFKTIPAVTKLLFLLPWLSGALALTYLWVLASLWRKRPAIGIWLLYGLNLAAAVVYIWFVSYWNLFHL